MENEDSSSSQINNESNSNIDITDLDNQIANINVGTEVDNKTETFNRWRPNAAEIEEKRQGKVKSIVISNAVDFRQIVLKNTVMADNTLFVKQILKECDNVGFFFPRRFCKSTLLSMTHFFLNAEIDKTTGLPIKDQWTDDRKKFREKFPQSKILQEDNFESSMLGKRICIKFSLDCKNADDLDELVKEFRKKFSKLFKEYSWLEDHLDEDEKKEFKMIKDGKEAESTDLEYALKNLANWLFEHFNKMLKQCPQKMPGYKKDDFDMILIILDNFNFVLNPSFRSSPPPHNKKRIVDFFDSIMRVTFKESSIVRGIVAGYFPISNFSYFTSYTILYAGSYAEFFGFNEEHFGNLCDAFSVNKIDRETAKQWYNGYTVRGLNDKCFTVYNPQNIINFLMDRKKNPDIPFNPDGKSHLKETFEIGKYADLFQKECIAETIRKLLKPENRNGIEMSLCINLHTSNIEALTKAAYDQNFNQPQLSELFFTFLLYSGYIDAKELLKDQSGGGTHLSKYNVVVPNFVHREELLNRIETYYKQILKDYVSYMPAARTALGNFYAEAAKNNDDKNKLDTAMEDFRQKLQEMLSKMPDHAKIAQCGLSPAEAFQKNERLFHVIFDNMVMELFNTSRFGTEVYCKCPQRFYAENGDDGRSDTSFIVLKLQIGVQVEHKFEQKNGIEDAMEQCVKYIGIYQDHLENGCIERILFIGTNFAIGNPVEMDYFLYKHGDDQSEEKLEQIRNGPTGSRQNLPRDAKNGGRGRGRRRGRGRGRGRGKNKLKL